MKYDVITFGSATKDIFIKTDKLLVGDFKKDHIEKEILLPLGHKLDIKEIHFCFGGGGTNTAATFVAQGLETAYCGILSQDVEGKAILADLKERGIKTNLVSVNSKEPTNTSIVISLPEGRTILAYKGASSDLSKNQIPWQKVKNTNWFYLAPLYKKSSKIFGDLVNFAKNNKIKVMANPGNCQLNLPSKILYSILKKIDILILNQEEGQALVKNNKLKGERLVEEIKKIFFNILVLTDGKNRVLVSDEKQLFSVLPLKIKVLDSTGAGDAFGSGFLAGYIKHKGDINKAIKLAIKNSASCIKKWGAR